MDLNQLLYAHQVAVIRASTANDTGVRAGHFARVAEYADRVGQLRELRQMTESSQPGDTPGTIAYGSYAGEPAGRVTGDNPAPPAQAARTIPVESWEGEGGALSAPMPAPASAAETGPDAAADLPTGITCKLVSEYRVGPYVYQDLELAMAEHLRQLSDKPDGARPSQPDNSSA